jgi:hypothetical protein
MGFGESATETGVKEEGIGEIYIMRRFMVSTAGHRVLDC